MGVAGLSCSLVVAVDVACARSLGWCCITGANALRPAEGLGVELAAIA